MFVSVMLINYIGDTIQSIFFFTVKSNPAIMNTSRRQALTQVETLPEIQTMSTPSMTLNAFFAMNTNPVSGIMTTRTEVKMNKKDVATKQIANPHGKIFKCQTVLVGINKDYQRDVNQNRALEDKAQDFVKGELKWGQHSEGKAIIEKDGKLYLQTIEEGKRSTPTYEDENGNPVEYAAIKPFMPVPKPSPKQALEDQVKVRTFKFESIVQLVIKGDMIIKLVP